jgi:hypothetical protein
MRVNWARLTEGVRETRRDDPRGGVRTSVPLLIDALRARVKDGGRATAPFPNDGRSSGESMEALRRRFALVLGVAVFGVGGIGCKGGCKDTEELRRRVVILRGAGERRGSREKYDASSEGSSGTAGTPAKTSSGGTCSPSVRTMRAILRRRALGAGERPVGVDGTDGVGVVGVRSTLARSAGASAVLRRKKSARGCAFEEVSSGDGAREVAGVDVGDQKEKSEAEEAEDDGEWP